MSELLLHLDIQDQVGIFTTRQAGREAAALLGLDVQDQVRIATALSELVRDLLVDITSFTVDFRVEQPTGLASALAVELTFPRPDGSRWPRDGVAAAHRLVDGVEESSVEGTATIRIRKTLPPLTDHSLLAARTRLSELLPASALEELRIQNAELLASLEDLRRQREELRLLNEELEDTNRGVLALYNELSEELEETNRGVVALYAELDDKSDQLREAAEAKNRFWATVSHELRTPLNSVIGLTRLLLDPTGDPLTSEQRHQIGLIAESSGTLLALVNELLDLAKAERGALTPQLVPIDVRELVGGLVEHLRPLTAEGDVELVVTLPEGVPRLVSDPVMVTRILRNLLGNALKFTPEGRVDLTVHPTSTEMIFEVSDTGVGIPAEHQQHVFEEFYQVPGTAGGTGLGLSYARRLAELLGGRLELSSAVGEGTRITLGLPVPDDTFDLLVGHVLIVDDESAVRRSLRELLGPMATRVSEASDAAEALAVVLNDPPDLLLLDLRMPGGDGMDVLERLEPGIPVVLVTAVDVAALDDSRLDRAGAFVDKARLDRTSLVRAVKKVTRGHSEE